MPLSPSSPVSFFQLLYILLLLLIIEGRNELLDLTSLQIPAHIPHQKKIPLIHPLHLHVIFLPQQWTHSEHEGPPADLHGEKLRKSVDDAKQ